MEYVSLWRVVPFEFSECPPQTAGLVLAARLTEDPNNSVLVLESGGENVNDPALRTLISIDPTDEAHPQYCQYVLAYTASIWETRNTPGPI